MDNMISDMDNAASEFVTTFLEKKFWQRNTAGYRDTNSESSRRIRTCCAKNRYPLITESNPERGS